MLHKKFSRQIGISALWLAPLLAFPACSGSIGAAGGDQGGNQGQAGDSPDGTPDDNLPPDDTVDPGLPPLPPGAPCRVAVPMRRLTELQYRNAIRDIFRGQAQLAADFAIPTIGSPESGFSTDPGYNAVDLGVTREFNDAGVAVPLSIIDKLATLLPCAATANEACANTFIADFGKRAYRRPLQAAETATLLKAFKLGTGTDAFKDGIAAVVMAMLQSPQFLYQIEIGQPVEDEPGILRLTGHEIASRLSFMLWDSVPDDALLSAAASGALDTGEGIRAQAERMLADAKARPTVVRFAREWIHLDVPKVGDRKDAAYTAALASAMQAELDQFIGNSFLGNASSLTEFFTSSAGFANTTLTSFYQGAGGLGPRSGLFTQPALLTGLASPSDSSLIRRSVFVRRKVTCEQFPEPPNDAQAVEAQFPLPATATQRERSVARNENARCSGCHGLIDPLGFGFEGWDQLGRFRAGADASGDFVMPVADELAGPFTTVGELGERLAASPAVHTCMARQWFRFSFGRLDGAADTCSTGNSTAALQTQGSLRELMLALVGADEFRFRRMQ